MRPAIVSEWRAHLPPPFDKSTSPLKRRGSTGGLGALVDSTGIANTPPEYVPMPLKRRDSAPTALECVDRSLDWLRYVHQEDIRLRRQRSQAAIEKLQRLKQQKAQPTPTFRAWGTQESFNSISTLETSRQLSIAKNISFEEPTQTELLALANELFPPIEEAKVIITEYSTNALRKSEYTLGEVLSSRCILQPPDLVPTIRWIYVEYYKMGTFWGSDYRFAQWGTDPALFEKSPILLLQDRLAELDREAGRWPIQEEDIPGYKRIGKYYRQAPGCPEYLGLRVSSSAWLESESYKLLLDYLAVRPDTRKALEQNRHTDLEYGLAYINAVKCIREGAYASKPGLRELDGTAKEEGVYLYGSWDDNVERLEFWGANTLLSCGSPRFYKVVADRLLRRDDVLRKHPDCALLYYTLARVSIENDEMMQDSPERALNKVFAKLRNGRDASREHVELFFSLQRTVLEGLEYLEENKRELPIWGIPPFNNHQVTFHPDFAPSQTIQRLIQDEMDLIDKDFNTIIEHWESLKGKVDRYLDVLLQFRVMEQQELTVKLSHTAAKHQRVAVDEARSARTQARSVFVITAVTIVFLPLSFFTSYYGMNFADIANTTYTSKYFWATAGPISGVTIIGVLLIIRFINAVKDPVPDEEQGSVRSESSRRWQYRWMPKHTKIKDT